MTFRLSILILALVGFIGASVLDFKDSSSWTASTEDTLAQDSETKAQGIRLEFPILALFVHGLDMSEIQFARFAAASQPLENLTARALAYTPERAPPIA